MPVLGLPFLHHAPSRDRIAELFRTQRAADPLGTRIHDVCALGACFFAGWPTTYIEYAYGPVGVCMLIRLTGRSNRNVPGPLLWDRAIQALLLWIAVLLASWFWTAGSTRDWFGDIQLLRFTAVIPALYMVLDRRPALIYALGLGIACGQLSQVAQIAARTFDLPWLIHQRLPGRDSGWWDPVVGGSILCAGLGLHLPAVLLKRSGREMIFGAIGVIATLPCILATGTRGAMIGASLVVALGVALLFVRTIHSRSTSRAGAPTRLAILTASLLVVCSAAFLPGVRARIATGWTEIARAAELRDYSSDTGMRIAAWKWAWFEFTSRPIAGVGAGAFQPWAAAHAADHPDLPPRTLPHAHSTYFQALATTGLLGALALIAALALAVYSGLRDPDTRAPLSGYDAGPALALVGLLSAGLFDTIQVNQQTAYLLFILITLCVTVRPPLAAPRPAAGGAP